MNRRGFLSTLIGGVAATAAVRTFPFRVFSFPQTIRIEPRDLVSIRFVRAFDPIQNRMISRWDMLYGFGKLDLPPMIESGEVIKNIGLYHPAEKSTHLSFAACEFRRA